MSFTTSRTTAWNCTTWPTRLNTAYYNPALVVQMHAKLLSENGGDGRQLHALDAVLSYQPHRSKAIAGPRGLRLGLAVELHLHSAMSTTGSAEGHRAAGISCPAEAPRRDLQPGLQVLLLPVEGAPVSGQPFPHVGCAARGLHPAAHRGP